MGGSFWLRKGAETAILTNVSAATGQHIRVFNRGPGDILVMGDVRLTAGDAHDVLTSQLTAELVSDSPYKFSLVEWVYVAAP